MKIEYVTSSLGIGTELHISAAEYKRVNSESGFNDHAVCCESVCYCK